MKKISLLLTVLFLLAVGSADAQSDIKMRSRFGSESNDLTSLLYFENIGLEKVNFSGNDLKDKDYQISITKIVNAAPVSKDVVFDSKEAAQFKSKTDQLAFLVFTKVTPENDVKFKFQFNGFSAERSYKIDAGQKGFALKSFLGAKPEISIPLNSPQYILTYMMPYVRKDGSTAYCEVAQSGKNPEDLGKIYSIPVYFLIDIKFQ